MASDTVRIEYWTNLLVKADAWWRCRLRLRESNWDANRAKEKHTDQVRPNGTHHINIALSRVVGRTYPEAPTETFAGILYALLICKLFNQFFAPIRHFTKAAIFNPDLFLKRETETNLLLRHECSRYLQTSRAKITRRGGFWPRRRCTCGRLLFGGLHFPVRTIRLLGAKLGQKSHDGISKLRWERV